MHWSEAVNQVARRKNKSSGEWREAKRLPSFAAKGHSIAFAHRPPRPLSLTCYSFPRTFCTLYKFTSYPPCYAPQPLSESSSPPPEILRYDMLLLLLCRGRGHSRLSIGRLSSTTVTVAGRRKGSATAERNRTANTESASAPSRRREGRREGAAAFPRAVLLVSRAVSLPCSPTARMTDELTQLPDLRLLLPSP